MSTTPEVISGVAEILVRARERRDSHYPDAKAAAAEAVFHPGPERDAVEAQIRALWADAIASDAGE
jgi:hypothetical protein